MRSNHKKGTLEERMLLFILKSSVLISALLIVENLIVGYPFVSNYKWIVTLAFSLLLLYFASYEKYINYVKFILFIGYILVLLPFGWLYAGLNNAFTIAYSFLIYIAVSFLFEKKARVILMSFEVLIILLMFTLNTFFKELFLEVPNEILFVDLLVQILITFSIAGILLSVFASSYQKEKKVLAEYAALLDKQNKALEKLTMTDDLTQVYNRRYFFNYVNSLRIKRDCLIGMIDIDSFKNINDTYGHDIGDQVLKYISSTLNDIVEDVGIVARYGGDEFAVLIELTDDRAQEEIVQRINDIQITLDILMEPITISGGFVSYNGVASIDEVMHHADLLLYQVKSNGKNNVIFERTALFA